MGKGKILTVVNLAEALLQALEVQLAVGIGAQLRPEALDAIRVLLTLLQLARPSSFLHLGSRA